MKFLFADNLDFIDPGFDFERDEYTLNRKIQRDDLYPHEYFEKPPYDGILVSRAVVGDEHWKGKYTTAQSMRFKREGASAFLRYNISANSGSIMGDCGAFSYLKEENPPYTVPEMVDYYSQCGFTHGVSIDHVILGYNEQLHLNSLVPTEWQRRYDITLKMANEFINYCQKHNAPFKPIGVVQGWSPVSYTEAVKRVVSMGYDYIALGGMVLLKVQQIHHVLQAIREVIPVSIKLHIFGFTKADNIEEFVGYGIESFDSTSPLLRAFKDDRRNYLYEKKWYTAIRIPSADTSNCFKADILAGIKKQRELRSMENECLTNIRSYATNDIDLEKTLQSLARYGAQFSKHVRIDDYRKTLSEKPWEKCTCRVCRESGVEALIFRGSNRNKRRGFHNLWEYYRQLSKIRKT